jgi:uncharacterized protein (DUF2141 family)
MIRTSLFQAAPLAFAGVLALSALFAAGGAKAADLTLSFEGVKTSTGAVMAAVFASEDAYESGRAPVAGRMIPVSGETASVTLTGLKPGRYAVKAFHDVDGDGKMNLNPFGAPTEPFAFSNNAVVAMGPPKWSAAAFEVTVAGAVQTIRID